MGLYESVAVALGGLFCFRKPVPPMGSFNAGDLPSLKAGLYRAVEPAGLGPFVQGPLFLAPQTYVDTDWRGTVRRAFAGVRGALTQDGRIGSTLTEGRVAHWASRNGSRVSIDLREEQSGVLTLSVPGGTSRLSYEGGGVAGDSFPVAFLAHRGTHCLTPPPINPDGLYPANTAGAFEDSLATGYRGFEADVQVSKDGQFVVHHDESLRSGTDGAGNIHDQTWEAIEPLTVLGTAMLPEYRFSLLKSYFTDRLMRLSDVLARHLADPRLERLVVDIKPDRKERIADAAVRAFQGISGSARAKVVFLCELPEALRLLKSLFPEARCALEGRRGTEPLRELGRFIPEVQGGERGPQDAVSLNMGIPLARPVRNIDALRRVLQAAKQYGYPVVGWTINRPSELDLIQKEKLFPDMLLSDLRFSEIALRCLRNVG